MFCIGKSSLTGRMPYIIVNPSQFFGFGHLPAKIRPFAALRDFDGLPHDLGSESKMAVWHPEARAFGSEQSIRTMLLVSPSNRNCEKSDERVFTAYMCYQVSRYAQIISKLDCLHFKSVIPLTVCRYYKFKNHTTAVMAFGGKRPPFPPPCAGRGGGYSAQRRQKLVFKIIQI